MISLMLGIGILLNSEKLQKLFAERRDQALDHESDQTTPASQEESQLPVPRGGVSVPVEVVKGDAGNQISNKLQTQQPSPRELFFASYNAEQRIQRKLPLKRARGIHPRTEFHNCPTDEISTVDSSAVTSARGDIEFGFVALSMKDLEEGGSGIAHTFSWEMTRPPEEEIRKLVVSSFTTESSATIATFKQKHLSLPDQCDLLVPEWITEWKVMPPLEKGNPKEFMAIKQPSQFDTAKES